MIGFTVGLKKTVLLSVTVFAGVSVLIFADGVRAGVQKGIALCANTVIPSLFLFTAVSLFAVKSGVLTAVGRFFAPISERILGLDGTESSVFLLSCVAGYPVGARLLNDLYASHRISRQKARRILMFCVGAGPAFILTAVGKTVLGSAEDGKRLLLASCLASVIMAFLSYLVEIIRKKQKTSEKPSLPTGEKEHLSLSDAFVLSVSGAAETMITVCAFVVAFSGVLGALESDFLSLKVTKALLPLIEVTSGVTFFGRAELIMVAFLIGFGGLSVHLQILSAAGDIRPPFWEIFLSRTVHGTLSAGIIAVLEVCSPRSVETVSMGNTLAGAAVHGNPLSLLALLLVAVTLTVFVSKTRQKNDT